MFDRRTLVAGSIALGLSALGIALLWPDKESSSGEWRFAASGVVEVLAEGCGLSEQRATGAVVAEDRVATVAHVVVEAEALTVRDGRGRRRPARLVALDAGRDLALLEVAGLEGRSLPRGELETGEAGRVLRFAPSGLDPLPFRLIRTVRARIPNVYGTRTVERDALEIDAAVDPGDSGAALVDDAGALVGIVFAMSRQRKSRAYAVAASELERFLSAAESPAQADPCP